MDENVLLASSGDMALNPAYGPGVNEEELADLSRFIIHGQAAGDEFPSLRRLPVCRGTSLAATATLRLEDRRRPGCGQGGTAGMA